jgi:hypothetical protein
MTDDSLKNKLELHYYFDNDDVHSMDAVTRNKCENEILQILTTISKELNINIKSETEAYQEGGLKELWSFLGSVEGQQLINISNFLVALLALILSRVPQKKTKLDKLEQELRIEEHKLNIELLKKELIEKGIEPIKVNLDRIDFVINNSIQIIKHKSNFYKLLNKYPKVKKLSTNKLNSNNIPIEQPNFVERVDFDKFILESEDLSPLKDENATIEIISPVLKKGNFKWKGFYNQVSTPIDFALKDNEYRKRVIEEGESFKNGTFIDCILEISRKIDDLGNIYYSNYSVLTVLKSHFDGVTVETKQGRAYRNKKDADSRQMKLFGNDTN